MNKVVCIGDLQKEIHENAIANGWWEEKRPFYEIAALIHSEWSEALEEYRADRPMVWHACCDMKPEGIAVELIDGCIRILDFLANISVPIDGVGINEYSINDRVEEVPVTKIIAHLHLMTAYAFEIERTNPIVNVYQLKKTLSLVFSWLKAHDVDPLAVMQEKHAYNKARPYRHGGKLC